MAILLELKRLRVLDIYGRARYAIRAAWTDSGSVGRLNVETACFVRIS